MLKETPCGPPGGYPGDGGHPGGKYQKGDNGGYDYDYDGIKGEYEPAIATSALTPYVGNLKIPMKTMRETAISTTMMEYS